MKEGQLAPWCSWRAAHRLGLAARGQAGGGDRRSDHRLHGATGDRHTLSDLGISKAQSSRWQQLAAVPEEQFEAP